MVLIFFRTYFSSSKNEFLKKFNTIEFLVKKTKYVTEIEESIVFDQMIQPKFLPSITNTILCFTYCSSCKKQ